MPPQTNRTLQHFLPLAADKGKRLPLHLWCQKGKDVQENVSWQALHAMLASLHTERVSLKYPSAFLCTSTAFAVLLTALAHFAVAPHCNTRSCYQQVTMNKLFPAGQMDACPSFETHQVDMKQLVSLTPAPC